MKAHWIFLVCRLIAAVILLQTLFFKFTAAEESVALFSQLSHRLLGDGSLEPLIRVGTGLMELVAAVLLLIPRAASIASGAFLSATLMVGAVMSHLAILGVKIEGEHGDDGGGLFALAVVVLAASLVVVYRYRGSVPFLGKFT